MNQEVERLKKTVHQVLAEANPERLIRSAGSIIPSLTADETGKKTLEFLMDLEWVDATENIRENTNASFGKCRYYKAMLPGGDEGILGATSVEKIYQSLTGMTPDEWDSKTSDKMREFGRQLGQKMLDRCQLVWGKHGPEIQAPRNAAIKTGVVYLIIGNGDDPEKEPAEKPVVYTWHPGVPVSTLHRLSKVTVKFV